MTGHGGSPVALPTTTVNLVKTKSSLYAKFSVGGTVTQFLVDSGAEISVLPSNHPAVPLDHSLLKPIVLQPITLDGKPLDILGTLVLEVEVDTMVQPVQFYISQLPVSPVMGSDVMSRFSKVIFNYVDRSVRFCDPLEEKVVVESPIAPVVGSLILREDTVIPPRHEVLLAGMLEVKDPNVLTMFEGSLGLFEAKSNDRSTLSYARTLGSVKNGLFPLRICNPLTTEAVLKKNSQVGTVTLLEPSPVVSVLGEKDDVTEISPDSGADPSHVLDQMVAEAEVSNSHERSQVRGLLEQYRGVFSFNGELGRYKDIPFSIDTGNAAPVRQMPRRIPHHFKAEVDRQIDEMLSKDVIEPSTSAWASPVCLVRKPDGSLRFCVDYRRLNLLTKHDAFPLPNISDCLDSLGGSTHYTILDCYSGYWQMDMDRESAEKAAITTHRGLFQPKVLPFGVRGGVAHFSRVMSTLFSSLQWKILLIYLDDLLVFAKSFDEHLGRLEIVFKRLMEAGLKLKPSKCHLFQRSVKFLGHVVSAEGVAPNADKVSAVARFPTPRDAEKVKSFLGLCGYYRDFIPQFATIAKPLTELTSKSQDFVWNSECENAFRELKSRMVRAPVLAYPDFEKEFTLTTDASDVGLGAVLSQQFVGRERVIAYGSRSLSKAERNYSTTEKETLAVVWATEHFSHYLLGAEEFLIRTDHDPLTYLRSIPSPRGRLARWMALLDQYSYRMVHIPGKLIPHADSLSRSPQVAVVDFPVGVTWAEMADKQRNDPVLSRVLHLIRSGVKEVKGESLEVQQLMKVPGGYFENKGVLCVPRKAVGKRAQVLVPRSLVPVVLSEAHDEAGHYQSERTLSAVRDKYYWGSLFKDVENYCRSCDICQHRNSPVTNSKAPLGFIPIPTAPWQSIALDFVGPLVETEKGNKNILVVTDMLTKYVVNLPLPDQKAVTTAEALFKLCCTQSFPSRIHTDQGKNFESELLKHLCEMLAIDKTRTTGYHPQCNGQTERYNKTMISILSKYTEPDTQNDWDDQLLLVAFSYNTTVHSTTQIRPFDLQFGRAPQTRVDLLVETPFVTKSKEVKNWLTTLQTNVKKCTKMAQDNIAKAQLKRKEQYGQDSHYEPYKKGELVLCRKYKCSRGLKPKLLREKWDGPWTIKTVMGPVNYRIIKGSGKQRKSLIVHHNRLKRYVERNRDLLTLPAEENAEAEDILPEDKEDDRFEVELDINNTDVEDQEEVGQVEGPIQHVAEQQAGPGDPVNDPAPAPLMGKDGRAWCNINEANVLTGPRRRH